MNNLIKTYENNFNPHSHEGSDTGRIKRVRRMVHFNPHSHKGSDLLSLVALLALLEISIHTPTKGATKAEAKVRQHISNFNPHSHEGSDKGGSESTAAYIQFQSTLPRRERRRGRGFRAYVGNFNPHSHEGSDCCKLCSVRRRNYFNPHSHEGSDEYP